MAGARPVHYLSLGLAQQTVTGPGLSTCSPSAETLLGCPRRCVRRGLPPSLARGEDASRGTCEQRQRTGECPPGGAGCQAEGSHKLE